MKIMRILNTLPFRGSGAATAILFGQKLRREFSLILNALQVGTPAQISVFNSLYKSTGPKCQ